MLTIKKIAAAAALSAALAATVPVLGLMPVAWAANAVSFASPEAAYDQGLGALRAGKPELAVPAFAYAGSKSHVPALYYLGILYANNDERLTDHPKAFDVFQRIVEQHAYVDPVSDFRSVYVARSAVRLAGYYRSGVPALNLKPDLRAAIELLNHAATYFGDLEAQFQLAKMHLAGEGVEGNERVGLHWLSRLAHKNHPGAQAFLAELMWRGKFVGKDADKALLWSTLSVEGAGDQDRIWIEEVHQTIYCGAPSGVRERAGQLVAEWRRRSPVMTGSASHGAQGGTGTAPSSQSGARADGGPAVLEQLDRTLAQQGAARRSTQASQGATSAAPQIGTSAVRTCADGEPVPVVVPGATGQRSETAPVPVPMPVIDKNAGTGPASALSPVSGAAPPTRDAGGATVAAPPAFGQGFTEFGPQSGQSGPRRK